jgi:hypothetical protein
VYCDLNVRGLRTVCVVRLRNKSLTVPINGCRGQGPYLSRPTMRTAFQPGLSGSMQTVTRLHAWWRKNQLLKVNTSCGPARHIFIYKWGAETWGGGGVQHMFNVYA